MKPHHLSIGPIITYQAVVIHREEEKVGNRLQPTVVARSVGTVKQSLLYEKLIFRNRLPFDFVSLHLFCSGSISFYSQPSTPPKSLAISVLSHYHYALNPSSQSFELDASFENVSSF